MAERFSVGAMVAATQGLYDELVAAAATGEGAASRSGRCGGAGNGRPRGVSVPPQCGRLLPPRDRWARLRGIPFRIFSLRSFDSKVIHGAAKPLDGGRCMCRSCLLGVWLAKPRFALRTPGRYLGALGRLVGGLWRPAAVARPQPRRLSQDGLLRRDRPRKSGSATFTPTGPLIPQHRPGSCPSSPAPRGASPGMPRTSTWTTGMLRDKIRAAKFVRDLHEAQQGLPGRRRRAGHRGQDHRQLPRRGPRSIPATCRAERRRHSGS